MKTKIEEKCQKGYKTHDTRKTKKMFGKTYRNCVKAEGVKSNKKKKIKVIKKVNEEEGKKNWGNKSKKNEEVELQEKKNCGCGQDPCKTYGKVNEEFKAHDMYDPKTGKKTKANKEEDHNKLSKKGHTHVDPDDLKDILSDEGGAAGLDPLVKGTKSSEEEVEKTLSGMDDVGKHEDGDYIMDDNDEVEIKKEEVSLKKKIRIRIIKKIEEYV